MSEMKEQARSPITMRDPYNIRLGVTFSMAQRTQADFKPNIHTLKHIGLDIVTSNNNSHNSCSYYLQYACVPWFGHILL